MMNRCLARGERAEGVGPRAELLLGLSRGLRAGGRLRGVGASGQADVGGWRRRAVG